METETKPTKTFPKVCDECQKPFEARKSNAHYCSSTCRSKASVRRSILNGNEQPESVPKRREIAMPTGIATDPASQFIIDSLNKEVDRFEKLYDSERTDHKAAKKLIEDLKADIQKRDTDAKIAAATVPQKSALDGFLEHPMAGQLMQHIGPAIGELSMQMVKKATAPKANGAQALAGADNSVWGQFTNWLSQQPDDVQQYVGELMMAFTQIQGAEVLQKLYQVRELIMGQYMRATG